MSARDELARLVSNSGTTSKSSLSRADAILAAGYSKPRTITQVVGVNALPLGAAIRTAQGYKLEKLRDGWYRPGVDYAYTPNPHWLPATVLYEP